MRTRCFEKYEKEREQLTPHEIDEILAQGRNACSDFDLSSCLKKGGVVVFPHTYLHSCGRHIAATVQAALDSGADQVLALGVLHSLSENMKQARMEERTKGIVSDHGLRGVHGPGLPYDVCWKAEYSLLSFLFFWQQEIMRRGSPAPKLFCRYPYLANRSPETLPGIEELEAIARDAVIVATADFCHNGVAYKSSAEPVHGFGPQAELAAQNSIREHLKVLEEQGYESYYKHCDRIASDAYDVASVAKHLRGALQGELLELAIVDTSPLFEWDVQPSWVAASLVAMRKT